MQYIYMYLYINVLIVEKQAGRIVLGSYMFARGKELDHWNDMVANPMEQFQRQHILS